MHTGFEQPLLGNRRDGYEVVRDILTIALNGARATRIVYGANLTFTRFKKHSGCLVSKGLLVVEDYPSTMSGRIYRTTEKGKRLLQLLSEASQCANF